MSQPVPPPAAALSRRNARMPRPLSIATLALVLALAGGAAWAETAAAEPGRAVDPDINAYYHDTNVEQWRETFESEGREVFDRRAEIVAALDLTPGMDIADVGAGTGLYTLLFARAVGPTGKVYAVDVSADFINAIGERAAAAGLANIVPVMNRQQSTELAPASVDAVFIADTYHHFEFPGAMLASIHQALRPGGALAIIDFRRLPGVSSPWVLSHVRAGREQVIEEVERAGFRFVDEPVRLGTNYFVRFRRVDG